MPEDRTVLTSLKIKYDAGRENGEGRLAFADPHTIDMNDAEVALAFERDSGSTQAQSNILYVDPNSAGGTEDLLLPPEADSAGECLIIVNTAGGAEDIVVKDDGDSTTVATIGQNEYGIFVCDGTTWRGGTISSTTEQAFLSGVTAGTVTASKAVVVDSSKDIGDFRNLDATNFDAGLSGTAGSVDVFPSTASKGKLSITAADSAGDTTTGIVNASQSGARTFTIPDPGASANFGMNIANQIDVKCRAVRFTEAGAGTSYTGTIPIPANSLVLDIQVRSLSLWDGTSASMTVGDDDTAGGYFTGVNLKATDLLVGEVLSILSSSNWGGAEGAYLVTATGLKSASYYAAANNIIGVVTPGAADGSAGVTLMHVFYATPTEVASTNV